MNKPLYPLIPGLLALAGCLDAGAPATTASIGDEGACRVVSSQALPAMEGDCAGRPALARAEDGSMRAAYWVWRPEQCIVAGTGASGSEWTQVEAHSPCRDPQLVAVGAGWLQSRGTCLGAGLDGLAVSLTEGCFKGQLATGGGVAWIVGHDTWYESWPLAVRVDPSADTLSSGIEKTGAADEGEFLDPSAAVDDAGGLWFMYYVVGGGTWLVTPEGSTEPVDDHIEGYVQQVVVGASGELIVLHTHRSKTAQLYLSVRSPEGQWSEVGLPEPDDWHGDCSNSGEPGDTCSFAARQIQDARLARAGDDVLLVARRATREGVATWRCDLQSAAPPPHNTYCDWDSDASWVFDLMVAPVEGGVPQLTPVAGSDGALVGNVVGAPDGTLTAVYHDRDASPGSCQPRALEIRCDR